MLQILFKVAGDYVKCDNSYAKLFATKHWGVSERERDREKEGGREERERGTSGVVPVFRL